MWNTTIEVPIPQLLFHSPDLLHKFFSSIGITNPVKRVGIANVSALAINETDEEESDGRIVFDTADCYVVEPVDLLVIVAMINETVKDLKVDPGALASVVPLMLVRELQLKSELKPSKETLRFAGGQHEACVGSITLPLLLHEDLQVRHSFFVAEPIPTGSIRIGLYSLYWSRN